MRPSIRVRHNRAKLLIFLPLMLAACATDYYGYSYRDWQSLDEAQREAAIREYDAMLEAERDEEYRRRFIDPLKESIIQRGVSGQGIYTR